MKKLIIISSLLINFHLFAHGGNKPGPHGGKIKMPGMFHTELIINNKNSFKVYLLDMKFKNPTTERSEVHYSLDGGLKTICELKKNFFLCKNKKVIKKGSTLKVHAKRFKQRGTAIYKSLMKKVKVHSKMHH